MARSHAQRLDEEREERLHDEDRELRQEESHERHRDGPARRLPGVLHERRRALRAAPARRLADQDESRDRRRELDPCRHEEEGAVTEEVGQRSTEERPHDDASSLRRAQIAECESELRPGCRGRDERDGRGDEARDRALQDAQREELPRRARERHEEDGHGEPQESADDHQLAARVVAGPPPHRRHEGREEERRREDGAAPALYERHVADTERAHEKRQDRQDERHPRHGEELRPPQDRQVSPPVRHGLGRAGGRCG